MNVGTRDKNIHGSVNFVGFDLELVYSIRNEIKPVHTHHVNITLLNLIH